LLDQNPTGSAGAFWSTAPAKTTKRLPQLRPREIMAADLGLACLTSDRHYSAFIE